MGQVLSLFSFIDEKIVAQEDEVTLPWNIASK